MILNRDRPGVASVASWFRTIGVGLLVTLLFDVVVVVYESLVFGGYSVTPTWLAMQFVGSLGTIGLPVVLWSQYKFRTPLVFMGLVVSFYVLVPVFGGGGDAPPVIFLVVLAPVFVGTYLLLAGVEYLLRFRKEKTVHPV